MPMLRRPVQGQAYRSLAIRCQSHLAQVLFYILKKIIGVDPTPPQSFCCVYPHKILQVTKIHNIEVHHYFYYYYCMVYTPHVYMYHVNSEDSPRSVTVVAKRAEEAPAATNCSTLPWYTTSSSYDWLLVAALLAQTKKRQNDQPWQETKASTQKETRNHRPYGKNAQKNNFDAFL